MKTITKLITLSTILLSSSVFAATTNEDVDKNTKITSKELTTGVLDDTLLYLYEGYNAELFVFKEDNVRQFQKTQSFCTAPGKPSFLSELFIYGDTSKNNEFEDPYSMAFAKSSDSTQELVKNGAKVYHYTSSDGGQSGITATYVYPKPTFFNQSVDVYDDRFAGKYATGIQCAYAQKDIKQVSQAASALREGKNWSWVDTSTNQEFIFKAQKTALSGKSTVALVLDASLEDAQSVVEKFQNSITKELNANPWLDIKLKLKDTNNTYLQETLSTWNIGTNNNYDVAIYSKVEGKSIKLVFAPFWRD